MDMVTFLKIFKTFLFLGISTIIISFTSLSDARAAGADARHKQIVKCVENNYPARTYMTNHLLPWPNTPWVKMDCKKKDKIRVGMPWVLNDEEAPWYNAIEKGFYSDVCLDVELVGGGPGKNHGNSIPETMSLIRPSSFLKKTSLLIVLLHDTSNCLELSWNLHS